MSPRLLPASRRGATVRLATAVMLAGLLSPAGAAQRTVTNVATFTYRSDASAPTRTVSSNAATLSYAGASVPATLQLLGMSPAGTPVAVDGTQCLDTRGVFVPVPPLTTASGAAVNTASLSVQRNASLHAGDPIVIRLTDPDHDRDPLVRDTVDLHLGNGHGDDEVVRLLETGPDTGVFVGAVQSIAGTAAAASARHACSLVVHPNDTITVSYTDANDPAIGVVASLLVDPYGAVFDSTTGAPVDGAVVTLVSLATGRPADVRGDDGASVYPSTVVTGAPVSDASGAAYPAGPGAFRFPVVAPGDYQVRVAPPPGYLAPSTVPLTTLVKILSTSGHPFTVGAGSFGDRFDVPVDAAVKLDVPIDPVVASLVLQKQASIATASTGDFVQYRIAAQNRSLAAVQPLVVDRLPPGLRYRGGSLHVDGQRAADPSIAPDGRTLTIPMPVIAASAQSVVTYVTQVAAGAPRGDAVNDARATVKGATVSNVASVAVKIVAPLFSDRFTIIGRVAEGDCGDRDPGVAGARLLLDDGSYVVTDREGLYHFEAVRPGTHVVQLDAGALRDRFETTACEQDTRFAGRGDSRFVEGAGGSLMRADFHVRRIAGATTAERGPDPSSARAAIVDDATAAGGNVRWLEGRGRGIEWIFPGVDHNPRAPIVRIAIKHDADQTVRLSSAGVPVGALAFDGTETSADRSFAVSVWRGLPLVEGDNVFAADVVSATGATVTHLERVVHYANAPARAEWVPSQSTLIADGLHEPVLAVRFVDRNDRPVRAGLIGPYHVNPPYTAALAVELQQGRQLAGLDRNPTQYRVEGDDGIAYIELAPTTDSGSVLLQFDFERGLAGSQARTQELRTWLTSAQRDWVVVGFAKGTIGYDRLQGHAEALPDGQRNGVETSGKTSLYAKGQVLGDWLLTLAYDSAEPAAERRRDSLLGVIDPKQYYTLYGDGSQQRFDAASASKLYLKLERRQFIALFGDFETGMTQSKLARYSRTLNGVKTEFHGDGIDFVGFASETAQDYGRDEIVGNGTSGLYRLSRADLLINSERVRIETRDRFRSDVIVESRALTRYIDYDIDYAGGTLFFREPVLSRDAALNPNVIVAEYEVEGDGARKLTAGGRAAVDWLDGRVTTGVSAIHDAGGVAPTDLVGVDARIRLPLSTELRVEAARSRGDGTAVATAGNAHLIELEHDDERLNAVAYLRRQDPGFGLNQQNAIESGSNKAGIDAQYAIAPQARLVGQAYHLTNLANGAARDAASGQVEYRIAPWTVRGGVLVADDTTSAGERLASRQVTAGVTRSLFDNRLELGAQADVAIGGRSRSADDPSRVQLAAAYALTERWKLIGAEEYASGATFHALTTRVGLQADPWKDAKLTTTVNQSAIAEYGPRTFGVLGLKQSLPVGDHWTVDGAADGSRTFHGNGPAASTTSGSLVAPNAFGSASGSSTTAYGSSSGPSTASSNASSNAGTYGGLSTTSSTLASLTENFTSLSFGATWRADLWTWTGRVESRDGQLADRRGLTTAFLRQADAGVAFAGTAQVFGIAASTGVRGTIARADLSWAWRPLRGRWSALDKLEFKRERLTNPSGSVDGALFGANSLQSSGDVRSTRVVNNLAINGVGRPWTARDVEGDLFDAPRRSEWAIYYGSKYVLDRYDDADYKGYTDLVGVEARIDVARRVDVGARVNVLHAWASRTVSWSAGPSIGFTPFDNAWLSVGYNVVGFHDRDFGATDYTARGPYVTMRFKFDQGTLRDATAAVQGTR